VSLAARPAGGHAAQEEGEDLPSAQFAGDPELLGHPGGLRNPRPPWGARCCEMEMRMWCNAQQTGRLVDAKSG